MLYPIELWVRARDLNHPSGLFIPSGARILLRGKGGWQPADESPTADCPTADFTLQIHCLFHRTLLD